MQGGLPGRDPGYEESNQATSEREPGYTISVSAEGQQDRRAGQAAE